MSYRSTRARKEFEAQITQATRELIPLHQVALKTGGGGAGRLLAVYYVFAFAQLEVYVKTFVEDSLSALSTANPRFDKWPDLMMAYLLHKGEDLGAEYRKFGMYEDENAILEKLAQIARKVAAWGTGAAVPIRLDTVDFLNKKKYPSPKNLPQLFRRMGIQRIWAVISSTGRINSELILTSLNDLRTDIAHEGKVPPGFGLADFRNRIKQMRSFVAALDRGVSDQYCRDMISRANWNREMA